MIKEPINPSRFICRWAVGVLVVIAVLAFSLGHVRAQAPKPLLDINTATQPELEAVKGVGAATAKKIIAGRPYKSLDELTKAGLSAKKIEALKPLVTVGKAPAAAPVDLNTADQKALESLPGIGPALAKKIMEGRPFKGVDDLSRIKGMHKSKIDAIKNQVTVTDTKLAPGEKVNINTADQEDLDRLPGIGPVKAQAIIEARPFGKIEDIMKVKGIKEGEFGKIKDLIIVK